MMLKKPVYVTKAFLPPFEEYVEGLRKIWDSAILTNHGPFHNELVDALKKYLQVTGLSLFVNGHQALEIALKAFRIEGEVITTPFSFASTTHAIINCGMTPVFCDIRPDDCNIDETKIEDLITPRTSAILPVHVYGNPCNIAAIQKIAQRHGLKVIYDAAHAFGVSVKGVGIGNFGDISMFSFHATKVFNTIEGGALTFSDPTIEKEAALLRNFGIAGPEDVLCVGTNAKMNEFQALMGLLILKYVDNEIKLRKQVVDLYRERLAGLAGIRLFEDQAGINPNYAYFPVQIEEAQFGLTRNELFDELAKHNIIARKYFYPLISDYACYRGKFPAELPVAIHTADRIMTLPLWGEIPVEIVENICTVIWEAHRSRN